MEKFNLTKLPELRRHPELKGDMESALELIQAEQYRAAAGDLRQALEYMVDCYMEMADSEEKDAPANLSLYNKIELLKNEELISFAKADAFHSIRMRCNAGVHRNSGSQGKQATPADIRYCYELLLQELPEFFEFFPGEEFLEVPETLEEPKAAEVSEKPEILDEPKAAEVPEKPKTPEGPKAADSSRIRYSILEDRSGEATEGVFADMMEELLRKMK